MTERPHQLDLLIGGDEDLHRALMAVSAAARLTDPLAAHLIANAPGCEVDPEAVVDALHLCNFVIERNSEWYIEDEVRTALLRDLLDDAELSRGSHERLLEVALEGLPAGDETPRYLTVGPGAAYHRVFLDADEAPALYGPLVREPLSGNQWLAAKLATEQRALGVLSPDLLEVELLRGIVLYREKDYPLALQVLRPVADATQTAYEVATAAHVVGKILQEAGDKKWAEKYFRKSLDLKVKVGDVFGEAIVRNTLGQLLAAKGSNKEAETHLERSIELGKPFGQFRAYQAMHTLGDVISRDRTRLDVAEQLLSDSIDLGNEVGDKFHVAQVLHTLAAVIGEDPTRRARAFELLERSMAMGGHRPRHLAQVLLTWGRLIGKTDPKEGAKKIRESLRINRADGNAMGVTITLNALKKLGEPEVPPV